jgi:hypothetical protein
VSDEHWSDPPQLHRHRSYEAADVEAFVEHITARVADLERKIEGLVSPRSDIEAELGRSLIVALQAAAAAAQSRRRASDPELERQAEARRVEADRYYAERLAEADLEAQMVLEQARADGRALVEAVRQSLDDALRLKDEELLAAVNESHDRVLAIVEEQLRAREAARPRRVDDQ